MAILVALVEAIGVAFGTMFFFSSFLTEFSRPILNGLVSFLTKVPVTDDQTKAVVFLVLVLCAFVPLMNNINKRNSRRNSGETKKPDQGRKTGDGELEKIVGDK